jgi:hypothetical protein
MSNKSDQPLPENMPTQSVKFEDLPQEQRDNMVQKAADMLITAVRRDIDKKKTIDFVDNEITTRIMFVHLQVLTKLLVEKGLISEASVQEALIQNFVEQAKAMSQPQLLVPKH